LIIDETGQMNENKYLLNEKKEEKICNDRIQSVQKIEICVEEPK
jgi:hypothetical protein